MRRCLACLGFLALLPALSLALGAPGDKKGPPGLKLSEDEKKLLEMTNKERAKEKLPPLVPDPILFKVARAHAANMARQEKMEHVLDGKNPIDRVAAAGYNYLKVGENIGVGDKGAPMEDAMKGWMESPLHRENILNRRFQDIGLGIVRNDKGETYYAQVFGSQRKKR